MAVQLSPVYGVAGQVFNDNGDPLAGGKIYTYLAGTTTPAATYTNAAGIIAHSNPIVLDGAGRVPSGEIWLTDGITYKFVVKDAADVLIGTYDNLTGINSNFVAYTNEQEIQTATAGQTVFNLTTMQYQPGTNNLSVFVDGVNQYGPGAQYAFVETDSDTVTFVSGLHVGASVKFTTASLVSSNATDAENVSYTPPFANSVTTNVEAKLGQYVSVKDYGAVGDGVADDTAAINDAMSTNLDVFFPAGTYRMTSSVTIPTSTFTKFFGEGNVPVPASKILVDFDGPAFVSTAGSTSFYIFESLFCELSTPGAMPNGAFIEDSGDAVHCEFNKLVLRGFKQPAINLAAGFVCKFEHVLIQYCYDYGIKVAAGSDNRFVRVLADFTYGGGIDAFGSGFVIDNFYSENSCQRNDPATFNESWRDIKLAGTNHTIVGGLIASYPQNNKAPILLPNCKNATFIGMRGFSLGTGAPSFVEITGVDGGAVFQQCDDLTFSGTTRNTIEISADGGAGTYPDIKLTPLGSVWSGAARVWACFNGSTGVLKQSQGVQSITKNATGDYTITFYANTFANPNYVVNANAFGSGVILGTTISSKLAGSVRFFLFDLQTYANVDSTDVMITVNGI